MLDTSYPNIHHAFTPLAKEGLITRSKQSGTVVRPRQQRLECVAIYLHHWTFDMLPPFQHALVDFIGRKLREQGVDVRLVIDNFTQFGLDQIRQWARTGRIQGVILPFSDADARAAIKELPVLAAFQAKSDWRQLMRLAVAGLKRQGCRKVGLVCSIQRGGEAEPRARGREPLHPLF